MNIPQLILGISSVLVGGKTAADAIRRRDATEVGAAAPAPRASHGAPGRARMRTRAYNVSSIQERVGHIAAMIRKGKEHADVRRKTTEVLTKRCQDPTTGKESWCIAERDHEAEVRAIFDSVREHVRYTGDIYQVDLFQHPARTLEMKAGDCDDYTIVLASMLQSVGYPVRLRVIRTRDSKSWNHIYLLAGLPPRAPSKWVSLDASVDRPAGWHPPPRLIAEMRDFAIR